MVLIWIYIIGAALVFTWLIFNLFFRSESSDRENNKGNYSTVTITSLFWFLHVIFNFKNLLNPAELFSEDSLASFDPQKRIHELRKIADCPPVCGNIVLYPYKDFYADSEDVTNIYFFTDDLVSYFSDKKLPVFLDIEAEAINSWMRNRDNELNEPREVPESINFNNIAFTLINEGIGTVECSRCGKTVKSSELTREVSPIHGGWNGEIFCCTEGHKLLEYNYLHMTMRRD